MKMRAGESDALTIRDAVVELSKQDGWRLVESEYRSGLEPRRWGADKWFVAASASREALGRQVFVYYMRPISEYGGMSDPRLYVEVRLAGPKRGGGADLSFKKHHYPVRLDGTLNMKLVDATIEKAVRYIERKHATEVRDAKDRLKNQEAVEHATKAVRRLLKDETLFIDKFEHTVRQCRPVSMECGAKARIEISVDGSLNVKLALNPAQLRNVLAALGYEPNPQEASDAE